MFLWVTFHYLLIGKPLIMRFSTSGKKMGYKCIDFPMLDNIISIYGIKTG